MNTKRFTLKFILTSIISAILIVMASTGILYLRNAPKKVSASNSDMLKIDLTNGNFNESTKSSYPYNPNGFTAAANNDSKKTGVINLHHDDYTNKFTNAKRSNGYDNYVLMLESDGTINYGFETSSSNSISIKANSHYMITVDVYTETDANIASLYLYDNDEEFASIKNINQHISWGTYYFLISTNDMDSYNLTLGMYLNQAGIALFDNIAVYQLSEQQLKSTKQTLVASSLPYVYKESNNYIVSSYKVENGNYVNSANSTDKTSFTALEYDIKHSDLNYTSIGQTLDSDGSNASAILLENSNKTYIKYATKDDFITFKQGQVYKVSLNIKTTDLDGNANLQLVRTNAEED